MKRTKWTVVAATVCALAPAAARADAPASGEQVAQARVLGNEGIKLADGGDCPSAIPKLEAAEQLFHAPTTLEKLGQCLVKTGKVVAGAEALLRVTREPLAAGAPPVFAAAQERAKAALPAAQARIAQLTVHLAAPLPSGGAITIDGGPFLAAMLDTERPTDPGPHEVRVTAPGFETATAPVTLADGEHKRIELALVPSAAPPVATAPPAGATPPPGPGDLAAPPPPAPASTPNRTPAYVAYGVGGVGLVVGVAFGVMALGTKSSLDDACPTKTSCPPSSQSDVDGLSTKAWIANAGFGVAILGAGIGTYFLLTSGGSSSSSASSAPSGVRIAPYFAGTGAGLTASF